MSKYEEAVLRFRIEYMIKQMGACQGNICEVARKTGVHRNTISRLLAKGGYSAKTAKHVMREMANGKDKKQIEIFPDGA